jgi:homocysteine S-methyltransferase
VFDEAVAAQAVDTCSKLGIPVLVGVLPLKNQKHCEFMHNEVPGVEIPEWLRTKMSKAQDDASGLAIGIEEAQRLSAVIRTIAQGLYLMPPFGSPQIAQQVMEAVV